MENEIRRLLTWKFALLPIAAALCAVTPGIAMASITDGNANANIVMDIAGLTVIVSSVLRAVIPDRYQGFARPLVNLLSLSLRCKWTRDEHKKSEKE